MSDETLTALLDELARPDEPLTDWHPLLPSRLSPTQQAMGEGRCWEQVRRVYVKGERMRPGSALIAGSADHTAWNVNWDQKITSGEDLPLSVVQDAYSTALDAKIEEAGGFDGIDWKEKPGKVRDLGAAGVAAYHPVAGSVQPVRVEQKIELHFDSVPVPVIGYPDVEMAAAIVERKTTGKSERAPKSHWRSQALTYQAALGKEVAWHTTYAYETPKTGKQVSGVNTPAEYERIMT